MQGKRFWKCVSLLVPVHLSVAACWAEVAAPPDTQALRIAEGVLETLGGRDAWEGTRYVSWHFFGMRRHWWDRRTGDVRIEGELDGDPVVILMNLDSRQGRVQRAGLEVTEPVARAALLERGYAWWVNDSYWMFMPYKLRDPGVQLRYGGETRLEDGGPADLLVLTFDEVGLTPRNRYEVAVARDTGRVESWAYYADRDDPEPRFTSPWRGWQRFGGILLATDHGRGKDWAIAVPGSLPASVFRYFAPVAVQR